MRAGFRKQQSGDASNSSIPESVPLTRKTAEASSQVTVTSGEDKAAPGAKSPQRSFLGLALDCVLVLLPLAFVGLLIAAALQDKKPESVVGDRIQDALLLSPTIFPIVFAAICGKTMKSIALYRSQDGMSLLLLEHLSGASSLFSALERVVILRSFGAIGIVTIVMWLLSPLGGQALSLRLLSKQHLYANTKQNATYLGPEFLNSTALDSGSGTQSHLSRITAIYLSALLSSAEVQGSPRDVWGNPKTEIPHWGPGETDASEWKPVISTNHTARFVNLIGLPVKAFGDKTTSEFVVSSIYMEVRCSSLEYTDTETFKQNLKGPLVTSSYTGGTFPNGTTSIVFPKMPTTNARLTTFLYVSNASWTRFESDITQPLEIFFGARVWETSTLGLPISLATCTVVPRGLETKLACAGHVCRAVAARKQPAELKGGGIWAVRAIMTRGHFCEMGTSYSSAKTGMTERFIFDGFVGEMGQDHSTKLYQIPLADFERRFQQVLNTFWYAATSQIFSNGNFSSFFNAPYALQTPAEVIEDLGLHYVCHWVWFGLALAIVFLLEGLAITNAVLRFRTRIPDIFGYVSSLTIGNKYCEGRDLEQSSALDGLERARALGHVQFQLADVKGGEDVGRIAFVPRGSQDEIGMSRVMFHRYYD
ncbi:hypothetical protein CPLU01_15817 [Colletotrichum plurivorum]|uniref:Uncharacterized protein n=1 Tax=Colletotrichum plurivorum TaxID=2175906 RepID=A0A8H6MT47_9PEZI|nr:hypothetical protein CPLU01_15817 [Colletotrichum plurivorum]